jgi:hypothetical protein
MREHERVDELIQGHRRFLSRAKADQPLFTIRRDRDSGPPPAWADSLGEGFVVNAEQLDIRTALDWYESNLEEDALVPDDGFMPAAPFFGIPWMEAILGCPVRVYRTALYAEPILDSLVDVEGMDFAPNGPWFDKLLELTQAIVDRFGPTFPVCTAQLRGPGDMMAALLGRDRLCLELYDHPQKAVIVAAKCANLWVEVTKAQLEIIPQYRGGYFNRLQIWTPGTTATLHIDFASLISRDMFQRFLLPAERRIAMRFDYPVYHTHASALHVIDDLAAMGNVAAIQVSLDRSVSRDTLLEALRRVQEIKPIIVHRLRASDLREFVDSLSPRGLCLCLVAETLEQAQEWIAWARNEHPGAYG